MICDLIESYNEGPAGDYNHSIHEGAGVGEADIVPQHEGRHPVVILHKSKDVAVLTSQE